jgi:hypothetical protein
MGLTKNLGLLSKYLTALVNGNIGFGVSNPSEKVEILGNIKSSGYVSSAQLSRYSTSVTSGSSATFTLQGSEFGGKMFMIHCYNNGNGNANITRLVLVNCRNTLFGGGNSIQVISTAQSATGSGFEITSLTQSIGGSGVNLTLVVTPTTASCGSCTITVEVQEIRV